MFKDTKYFRDRKLHRHTLVFLILGKSRVKFSIAYFEDFLEIGGVSVFLRPQFGGISGNGPYDCWLTQLFYLEKKHMLLRYSLYAEGTQKILVSCYCLKGLVARIST